MARLRQSPAIGLALQASPGRCPHVDPSAMRFYQNVSRAHATPFAHGATRLMRFKQATSPPAQGR